MASKNPFRDIQKLLRHKLRLARDAGHPSVLVGFTAAYALYVHENVQARNIGSNVPRKSGIGVYWGPNGGPKFLEAPAREMREEMVQIVQGAISTGTPLPQALLLAGYALQAEAMERVPVEHANLKQSAFTRLDGGPPATQTGHVIT